MEYPLNKAIPLCEENYYYCALPPGEKFPEVNGLSKEWYNQYSPEQANGQLEFRKYERNDNKCDKCGHDLNHTNPYTGWMVSPVIHTKMMSEKRFPQFEMSDVEVLTLWLYIKNHGGCVSDGILNLFGK